MALDLPIDYSHTSKADKATVQAMAATMAAEADCEYPRPVIAFNDGCTSVTSSNWLETTAKYHTAARKMAKAKRQTVTKHTERDEAHYQAVLAYHGLEHDAELVTDQAASHVARQQAGIDKCMGHSLDTLHGNMQTGDRDSRGAFQRKEAARLVAIKAERRSKAPTAAEVQAELAQVPAPKSYGKAEVQAAKAAAIAEVQAELPTPRVADKAKRQATEAKAKAILAEVQAKPVPVQAAAPLNETADLEAELSAELAAMRAEIQAAEAAADHITVTDLDIDQEPEAPEAIEEDTPMPTPTPTPIVSPTPIQAAPEPDSLAMIAAAYDVTSVSEEVQTLEQLNILYPTEATSTDLVELDAWTGRPKAKAIKVRWYSRLFK